MSRKLFKSAVAVGGMLMISRILGFIRDMLMIRNIAVKGLGAMHLTG